jgi:transketolase
LRRTFLDSLLIAAQLDPNIVFVTGDLGYGVVDNFARELPNQFINAGISEQAMMGMAAGLASQGKRVFVYSIGNFSTLRCLEQIRNDVCAMNNPVVIVSVGAGYSYGTQGYTHHAIEDIAIMRALPNIEILIPSDSEEVRVVTEYLCSNRKPAYLRLGKDGEPTIHPSGSIKFDQSPYKISEGTDFAILTAGSIASEAILAVDNLEKHGVRGSIYLIPSLSGLTTDFLKHLSRYPVLVSLEEHSPSGGFGSAILEGLNAIRSTVNLCIMAANQNELSEIGSQMYLRHVKGISHEHVESKILDLTRS